MDCTKTGWLTAALLFAIAGCGGDDGDDDTGAGTTGGSVTQGSDAGGSSDDDGTDGGTPGSSSDGGGSTGDDAATGTGHADETGHHETEGHESGETGEHSLCEILGEGCHDNMTPEGIDCHLTGHDGDEAACMKIFEMCAEICGLN